MPVIHENEDGRLFGDPDAPMRTMGELYRHLGVRGAEPAVQETAVKEWLTGGPDVDPVLAYALRRRGLLLRR